MEFDKNLYIEEMTEAVDLAISNLEEKMSGFEVFTMSIWTNPGSAISSIGFDSKANSDKKVKKSNDWNKKYYEKYMADGDFRQAKLFEPTLTRNTNPADFELKDFIEIKNSSFENDWEENSQGRCWRALEPSLKKVGKYAFSKTRDINVHPEFELSVNGRNDWYEFVWRKNKSRQQQSL